MRRSRFLIIVGILLGLATGGLFLIAMTRERQKGAFHPPVEVAAPKEELVVVAFQNIPKCSIIPADAVGIRPLPAKEIPKDAVRKVNEVVGKIAIVDIHRTKPIQKAMFTDLETILKTGSDASCAIPKGKVAVAFPITRLSSVAYAIQPGDRVDVLVSMTLVDVDVESQIKKPLTLAGGEECTQGCQPVGEQVPRSVTQLTVQNAEVLRVGLWPSEPIEGEEKVEQIELGIVTLLVSPQDALVLKWARENGALIDLALRSAVDEDVFNTEAVTLDYMLRRFNITVPPKLPYVLEPKEVTPPSEK
jgi:Flp pilus assembly protein CpaB